MALRLLIYDRTCLHHGFGLTTCWQTGARLYGALGRIDAHFGAAAWDEALGFLAGVREDEGICEIQYWGHGKWGSARIGKEALDASAFHAGHRLHAPLARIRERLTPDALLWFRTCETFGAQSGVDFARRTTDFFGVRAAGHTHVIGFWQSGLRGLLPGHVPDWSLTEGLRIGTPEAPLKAYGSGPGEPRTITCLEGAIPSDWFA